MKLKIIVIIFTILLFIGAVIYDATSSTTQLTQIAPTKNNNSSKVPNIDLTTISGVKINTHDFKGKIVLLNFWASWCPPCIIEMPLMFDLIEKYDGKVVLIALSNDEKEADYQKILRKFSSKYGHIISEENVHIVWDKDKKITHDVFNTIKYPETIIITPDLKMDRKIVGGDFDWQSTEFKQYLDNMSKI